MFSALVEVRYFLFLLEKVLTSLSAFEVWVVLTQLLVNHCLVIELQSLIHSEHQLCTLLGLVLRANLLILLAFGRLYVLIVLEELELRHFLLIFRVWFFFSARCNGYGNARLLIKVCGNLLDFFENVHSFHQLTNHDILSVKVCCLRKCNTELTGLTVNGQNSSVCMPSIKRLVWHWSRRNIL